MCKCIQKQIKNTYLNPSDCHLNEEENPFLHINLLVYFDLPKYLPGSNSDHYYSVTIMYHIQQFYMP